MEMRDAIHHEPGYRVISRANNAAKRREWYGSKYHSPYVMNERRGGMIGAALVSICTLLVLGGMLAMAIMVFPDWIGIVAEHAREVVASSLGVAP